MMRLRLPRGGHSFAGQHPSYVWEEQQRYWPSPRAPPASPTESPRTPGGSQKKAVLGKVKSKAKKWMHMLHHKKKPAQEEMMWTPRAGPGPSAEGNRAKEERRHAEYRGTPRKLQQHAPSCMSVTGPHGTTITSNQLLIIENEVLPIHL